MTVLVHLVADYGAGDLAFSEVVQRIMLSVPDAIVHPTFVRSFDTLSAGVCVAQLALTEGVQERIIVHNVAPRRDEPGGRPANEGERFCGGRTRSQVLVAGPNAGWSWSFLREEIALHYLDVPAAGSQFRSRDFLPKAVGDLAAGDPHAVYERVPDALVPPVPERVIAYIDGYGNLKTTITTQPAPTGTRVLVHIGEVAATAIVSDGTFEVAEGELAPAPGSSGWERHAGRYLRFFERFNDPPVGAAVEITDG
jgi:hypothetical protein